VPIYRLSVAQYLAMVKHGILTQNDRVELIRGWLVPKMTKRPPRVMACGLLMDTLPARIPAGWHLHLQDPTALEDSVPEPDGAVIRGARRDYDETRGHPQAADVALVIEVSHSSLDDDRTTKRTLYAEAGIPTYWIVNLVDNVIEVHTAPAGGDYTAVQAFAPGDQVPLVLGGVEVASVPVADLLP
jgi:Uma2 family endonuclease